MNRSVLTLAILMLAGCTQPSDSATGIDEAPVEPIESTFWQATTDLEGRGAVRLQVLLPEKTTCSMLLAANHPVKSGPESYPWFEVRLDGEIVTSDGGYTLGLTDVGVEAGPVNTIKPTRDATNQAFDAWYEQTTSSDNFTSWTGLGPYALGPGIVELFVQMDAGLQPARGVTDGHSALVRIGCADPVQARAQEDGEALLITSRTMEGGTNVMLFPALTLHQGSQSWMTTGPKTEIEWLDRNSEGTLAISGDMTVDHSWTRGAPTEAGGTLSSNEFTGPSGNLTLSWDFLNWQLGFAGGAVWSWEPIEPEPIESRSWPWQ